jgi:hypothetical protein
LSGEEQESNLPSVGLPRLTGFEDPLRRVHLRTEAGFRPRFSPSRCGEVRSDRYQLRYQVSKAVREEPNRLLRRGACGNLYMNPVVVAPDGERLFERGEVADGLGCERRAVVDEHGD